MPTVAPQLDLDDIQGTILRGYRVAHARHFLLRVVDSSSARRFLGRLVDGASEMPQITTAARWTAKPQWFLNLGITSEGLRALGVPEQSLDSFPPSFLRGATDSSTATLVGDVGESDPSNWVGGLSNGRQVHLILSLWAHQSREVLERVSAVIRGALTGALEELSVQDASALPDNKVHFGYTDNISQPQVEGAPPRKRAMPDRQPVAPAGEFLMGHTNQYGATYRVQPDELSVNSSFAAFRILEQDVAAFEELLQKDADPEALAAKVCGRWRNGVPLVLSPDTATPTPPVGADSINDFDYVGGDPSKDDTYGYRCPVGSHVRRNNPRGQQVVGAGGHLHRIIRRAMPYGPPYDPERPDRVPRGLVGYFINADLTNQFEFLMSQWVGTSSFVMSVKDQATGADPARNISGLDVLLGVNEPSSSSFTIPIPPSGTTSWSNRVISGFSRYVTTRGGAYCYLPSITALRHLTSCDGGGKATGRPVDGAAR
jgi:Dyp-type peroxidase family